MADLHAVVELSGDFNRSISLFRERGTAFMRMVELMEENGFEGDALTYVRDHDAWNDDEGYEVFVIPAEEPK